MLDGFIYFHRILDFMKVSIILPLYKPDKDFLNKILNSLKKQRYDDKFEIIKVDKGMGLAESLNYGLKKAKYEAIISLHQDCIPESNKWLQKLMEPLKEKETVVSVSKVELPYEFWKKFDFLARVMSIKEQRVITPGLDEKGCAYKVKALKKIGLFNEKEFKTAGEDVDLYLKIRKIGKIAYPDCKIIHYHKHTFKNRFRKEFQLSEGFGVLTRIYKREMPKWYLGFLKSIPILGWPLFLINFPYRRWILGGFVWIFLSLMINLIYSFGFWKGFLIKKQKFRIN